MRPKTILLPVGLLIGGGIVGLLLGEATADDPPAPAAAEPTTTSEPDATSETATETIELTEPVYVGPPLDEVGVATLVGTREATPEELAAATAEAEAAGIELVEPPPPALPDPVVRGTSTRAVAPPLPDDAPDPAVTCATDDPACPARLRERLAEEEDTILRTGAPLPDEGSGIPPACEGTEDPEECAALYERRRRLLEETLEEVLEEGDEPERRVEEPFEDECVRAIDAGEIPEEMPAEGPEESAPDAPLEELPELVECGGVPGTVELGDTASSVGVLRPVMSASHHPVCGDAPALEPQGSSLLFVTTHAVTIEGDAQPLGIDGTPVGDATTISGATTADEPMVVPAAVLDPSTSYDGTTPAWVTCLAVPPAAIETVFWDLQVQLGGDGVVPRSFRAEVLAPALSTLEGDAGDDFFFPTFDITPFGIYVGQLTVPDRRIVVVPRTRRDLTVDVEVDEGELATVALRLRSEAEPLAPRCGAPASSDEPRVTAGTHPDTFAPGESFDRVVRAKVRNQTADDTGRRGDLCVTVRTDATPSTTVAEYEIPVFLPDPPTYEVSAAGVFPLAGADLPTSMSLGVSTSDGRCAGAAGFIVADHVAAPDVFETQCSFATEATTFDVTAFPRYGVYGAEPRIRRFGFPSDPPACAPEAPCEVLQSIEYTADRSDEVAGEVLVRIRRTDPGTALDWTVGAPISTLEEPVDRGPGIRPGSLTITRSPDDPGRTIIVEGVADRPVESSTAFTTWIPSTRSPVPCTRVGGVSPGTSDPADPRRFRVVIDGLCPGTAYSVRVSITSAGSSNSFTSTGDFPDSTAQRGIITTDTLRVSVAVSVDFLQDRIGDTDGFMLTRFYLRHGPETLIDVNNLPTLRSARFGFPCEVPDAYDTEVVTEIELGGGVFSAGSGARTWRGGCPSFFDQLVGERNFGRDYSDHRPSTTRLARNANALLAMLERGDELRFSLVDRTVGLPEVPFAMVTIGPPP